MIKRASVALGILLLAGQIHAGELPKGWFTSGSAPDSYDFGVRPGDRHPGDRNAYIRAQPQPHGFATLMQTIKADAYRGKRLRLSAYLRTRAADSAAMWMRIDAPGQRGVGFDNMGPRALRGDTAWKRYEIVLDVAPNAQAIAFGFLLEGKGEIAADEFRLEEVGKDVPVTGIGSPAYPSAPSNLDFSQ